jgi:hypothetical protein
MIQNYWVFGLLPSAGFLELENTRFRKLDLFPPSGEGGEDTYSETSCFLVSGIPDDGKSPKAQ